jgi:nudix-type nucleoside diphosphatase (YffH/AdpP family)
MYLKIIKEKTVFDDQLIIDKGKIINENGKKFKRLRLKRENASTVLLFNTDSNKIILVKQFRYPIHSQTNQDILEIVAGKIEKGEDALSTAIKETEEETGYRLQPEKMHLMLSCFSSPDYSSERFYIYYAEVNYADKISEGGGIKSENEHIEIVEIDIAQFKEMLFSGDIQDAKTYLAGFYFFIAQNACTLPELFLETLEK